MPVRGREGSAATELEAADAGGEKGREGSLTAGTEHGGCLMSKFYIKLITTGELIFN